MNDSRAAAAHEANTTFERVCGDHDAGSIVLGVGLCLVAAVGVAGNLLTVAAFVADRSIRQKATNFYLLSLSCSDLLVSTFLPIRVSESICRAWLFGEGMCQFQVFYIDVAITAGFLSMSCIALDRYLLISLEYSRYLAFQSRRNVLRIIAVVWTISVVIAIIEIVVWNAVDWAKVNDEHYEFHHECLSPPRNNRVFALTLFIAVFLVPLISIVGMSLRFLVLLRRRLRGFKSPSTEASALSASGNSRQSGQPISELAEGSCSPYCAQTPRLKDSRGSGEDSSTNAVELRLDKHKDTVCAVDHAPENFPQDSGVHLAENDDDRSAEGRESNKAPGGASSTVAGPKACSARDQLRARYIRPAIIMGALITCFLICTLPYLLYISLVIAICPPCDDKQTRFHLSNVLFLNSVSNPSIYAATHRKIRGFHRRIFGLVLRKLRCLRENL